MSSGERNVLDIAIVGAGILGVSIAFWLSSIYDCSIGLIDAENLVGQHTSSRNTGVLHRPFYLDPKTKRTFARTAEKSYSMWSKLALKYSMPWKPHGTIEVAVGDRDFDTLQKYESWALSNGMKEEEIQILDGAQVSRLEPEVKCKGAIFSKTDTSVNFGEFTSKLAELCFLEKGGVQFFGARSVTDLREMSDGVEILALPSEKISCGFLINVAGGGALQIAHKLGLAKEYASLHFRGEYWRVDEPFASKIGRNVYSIPKRSEFPFLDPHFIVRASGKREIGPNAVLVSGPSTYKGLGGFTVLSKIFEPPRMPKFRLFTNRKFLSLALGEWRSSFSKSVMTERVRRFIPSLDSSMLNTRGISGVRSSLIDGNGFVPEAVEIFGQRSMHILNYNSPGASGAPSFSAYIVSKMKEKGFLDGLRQRKNQESSSIWNYEDACNLEKIDL